MLNVNYNPDVLSCLANLSSDEVFTPPNVANQMLDLLPDELWSDKNAKFLDPATKSGVFLREIAKRLMIGLEKDIPDLQSRVDHIMTKQLFGIGITEMTSLLARRSLYCSKAADSEFSICQEFDDEAGNIFFERIEHEWKNGKCIHCGASEINYSRDRDLETHAYQFIHGGLPERIKNMKFDVIIGNPPYQLDDGGHGASAKPIYQLFVQQAKKLKPRYISMIVPSRWFGGGRGLSAFREEMLGDRQIVNLVDFEIASDCFAGVDIAGGVCYFLWEKNADRECEIVNIVGSEKTKSKRPLNEFNTFVRDGRSVEIVRKILKKTDQFMNHQVSSSKPFGLRTFVRPETSGDLTLRWQKGEGPFPSSKVTAGFNMIDKWKVITSYVGYDHGGNPGKDGKRKVFSKVEILSPGTICNETYLVIGNFDTEVEAKNLQGYMKTKFLRFLVSQFMYSHHITKDAYSFVPVMDMKKEWTDENLNLYFQLTQEDISHITSKIREM